MRRGRSRRCARFSGPGISLPAREILGRPSMGAIRTSSQSVGGARGQGLFSSRGFAASEEARVTSRPSDGGGRTDAARSVRGVEIGVPLYMLGGVPVVGGLAYAVYGIWPSMYVVGKGERSQFSLPGLCPPGNGRFVDRPVSSVRAGCCHDHSEKNVTRNDRTGQCGSVQQRTREGIDSESHQMAPAPLGPLLSESRRPAALSCAYPPDGLYFGP